MIARDPATGYREPVLAQVRRLLSRQDREPFSRTYGCFDRTFWCWKFTDFAGARFQEGVYALAHLFRRPFPGNFLHQDARVLEWARAGFRYWQHLQYRGGSFDEAYPYEHSLAATAFTGFYVGEAFLLLEDCLSPAERDALRATFARAGAWLCRNDERHGLLSNHLAAAAAALQVAARICGDEKLQRRSRHFLQRIYEHQSSEGWYEEYGGADPGYQTHATFYLARIWQETRDEELLESLRRSVRFLTHCIHPNGTLGGEYASRNTEFYFPAGFEMLASALPESAAIAAFMRPAVARQSAAGLAAMDAYNFLPLLNNYLFAADHVARLPEEQADALPCRRSGEWYFPDAGLFVKSTDAYFSVLGLSKGGTLRVHDKAANQLLFSDCGYWAQLDSGRVASSQSLCRQGEPRVSDREFVVEAEFVQVNQRTLSPWLFLCFRLFTLTLGRLQSIAYHVKNLLVQVLVRRRKSVPLRLARRIRFTPDGIIIADEITARDGCRVRVLRAGTKFATIHMGSSRYFVPQELEPDADADADWAQALERQGSVRVQRVVPLSTLEKGQVA